MLLNIQAIPRRYWSQREGATTNWLSLLQTILIVEDEPDMVLGLRDNFEYEGYEVLVARDGREGLGRALSDHPDVILLDIMLPKLSGLDVCRELRSKGLETPVIMLTARG